MGVDLGIDLSQTVPSRWLDMIFDKDAIWDGWIYKDGKRMKFSDCYEMKPEYKKRLIQSEIDSVSRDVDSLTSLLGERKKQLEDKKKELESLG